MFWLFQRHGSKMNTTNQAVSAEPSAIHQVVIQLETFLRDIWRYRWASLIAMWAIAIAGWTFVYIIPDKYEASAKILVDTDSILRPLLEGLAVETDLQSRVSMMTRTLLSRPNLEKLVRATDMDLGIDNEQNKEALYESLRRQINIDMARNFSNRRGANRENLYTITYSNNDPAKSKLVVQELLTIFVETSMGGTRMDSEAAQKFLNRQIKEYETKLIEAEQRLMEFKRKNVGLIPGQGQDYFTRLRLTQTEYEQARFDLTQAQKRHSELQRQLNEMVSAASKPGSTSIPTATDTRIAALKQQLDNLLLKYTDEHPDVTEIKQSIVALEEQKKMELASIAEGNTSNAVLDSNPVYQELRVSLGQASAEIATAKGRTDEYARRIQGLNEKVEILPKIEAELASLNRDYEINKTQYDTLLGRRQSAKMSRDAENAGDQVKFQIVEPAHVPSKPSSPNRLLFNTAVLLAAVGGGFGLVFVFGQFFPVIHHHRALRDLTAGYPVFGSISMLSKPETVKKRKTDITIYAISMALLTITYLFVVIVQFIA